MYYQMNIQIFLTDVMWHNIQSWIAAIIDQNINSKETIIVTAYILLFHSCYPSHLFEQGFGKRRLLDCL